MKGKVLADGKKDPKRFTVTEYLVGPNPKGPKVCLNCRAPFQEGEAWERHTSPPDPEFGSYAIGIHQKCLR